MKPLFYTENTPVHDLVIDSDDDRGYAGRHRVDSDLGGLAVYEDQGFDPDSNHRKDPTNGGDFQGGIHWGLGR